MRHGTADTRTRCIGAERATLDSNGVTYRGRDAPNPDPHVVTSPQAAGHVARHVAARIAPPVRAGTGLRVDEPGRRAGVLGFRGEQPAERQHLPRGHPRGAARARTTAPAPISRPTRWAPASTSSSCSGASSDSAAARAILARGYAAAAQRGGSAVRRTTPGAVPARGHVSEGTGRAGGEVLRRGIRRCAVRRSPPSKRFSLTRPRSSTTYGVTTMC